MGDSSWAGRLTTGGAELCVFPRLYENALDALGRKRRLRRADGTFNVPLAAAAAPFRLPACFAEKSGASSPPILLGNVSAERRRDFDDVTERYHVAAEFPLSDAAGRL